MHSRRPWGCASVRVQFSDDGSQSAGSDSEGGRAGHRLRRDACGRQRRPGEFLLPAVGDDRLELYATLSGPGYNTEYAVLAPMVFTANLGVGPSAASFDLLAFCVDIFHNITAGPLNLQYDETQIFNSNSDSPVALPISVPTQLAVGRLANYGQAVYDSGDAQKAEKLAGVRARSG